MSRLRFIAIAIAGMYSFAFSEKEEQLSPIDTGSFTRNFRLIDTIVKGWEGWNVLWVAATVAETNIKTQIDILEKKGSRKSKKEKQELDLLRERLRRLPAILEIIRKLKDSDEPYGFLFGPELESETVYDTLSHLVTFKCRNTSSFIHEIIHGNQYEEKSIVYFVNSHLGCLQDLYDEVEAYKAQFAYDPASVATLVKGVFVDAFEKIDTGWVRRIEDRDSIIAINGKDTIFDKPYEKFSNMRLNINSPLDSIMKVYPDNLRLIDLKRQKGVFKDIPELVYKGKKKVPRKDTSIVD